MISISESRAQPLLEVRELVTQYRVNHRLWDALRRKPRRTVRAVDNVSFKVSAGEFVALVGESGSGKTSVAQSIMRMVPVTSGSIRFRGQELTGLSNSKMRPIRREMQLIYQDPYDALDPRMRVRQTVSEPLEIHHRVASQEREARVVEALIATGLVPPSLYADRYPHELSGGQRQRVAIAAAMILRPKLLIADEPVSMLDVSVRVGVLNLFDEFRRQGLGILMITHDLSTAASYADRIAVMYLGRIVEEGPARDVVGDPQHPYTRALISAVPNRDPRRPSDRRILRGEPPNPTDVPPGCRFHPRCPVRTQICDVVDPDLWQAESGSRHTAACVRVGGAPAHLASDTKSLTGSPATIEHKA